MRRLTHPNHLGEWKRIILEERPSYEKIIVVSAGTCGRARGALQVLDALKQEIERRKLSSTIGLETTGCHGLCEMEPNIVIFPDGLFYKKLDAKDAPTIIEETILKNKIIPSLLYQEPATGRKIRRQQDIPFYRKQMRTLTENNVRLNPERLEDYVVLDGYQALAKALFDMTSDSVIDEVLASGLKERGGSGLPVGKKWELCREAHGHPKYAICNSEESDPGVYMGRSLLEANPQSLIEGLIIGAYSVGASEGLICVREEFPLALKHITAALSEARQHGLLGATIFGSEFHFDIHVVQVSGAYVSGDETSLMAAIEGRKAFPRQQPPYPAQEGLWGKPTVTHNAETWANVPVILQRGADWFARIGAGQSKGTRIFSLAGKINNTGFVEVPLGTTLRKVVQDIGGGLKNGKALKAVWTGGRSGGCIPGHDLNLPLDDDSLSSAGSSLGTGGIIVLDEGTCMVDLARYFLNSSCDESCGKCVPCRVGTRQMLLILDRIATGQGDPADIPRLEDLAAVMKPASLCGLGQAAATPVLATLRYFRSEYEAHIREKRCPAHVCSGLIAGKEKGKGFPKPEKRRKTI